jgi:hypothetical protein
MTKGLWMALLIVVLMLALDELVTLVGGGDVCTDDACDRVCKMAKRPGGSCILNTATNVLE